MNEILPLRKLDGVRQPLVRPAYRILTSAHVSVVELFDAVDALDTARRRANGSPKGRKSKSEIDILRSAIVLTSAGLDASMKRLVTDVGRHLIMQDGTGARHEYELQLKREMEKRKVSDPLRQAVLAVDPVDELLTFYLSEKTKASFQGSGDLKKRVRHTLGISSSVVSDSVLEGLNSFFQSRNKIVHSMDLQDPSSDSLAREHRDFNVVVTQCNMVFEVAVDLILGAVEACKKAKR